MANAADYPKHDHLFPEFSEFAFGGAFPPDVPTRDFAELYKPNVVARMIADMSALGEYGVGITNDGGNFGVISHRRYLSGTRKRTMCRAPIDRDLAIRAIGAWRKVLLGTRFSDDVETGADGGTFHFSMMETFQQPHGVAQKVPWFGMVWSPDPQSPPFQLVKLAEGLGELCAVQDAGHRGELTRALTKAADRLVAGSSSR
jgi:hypothetical protein